MQRHIPVAAGLLAGLLAVALAGPAAHASETGIDQAYVPLTDTDDIKAWHVVGNRAILIETRDGRWYRGTFFDPCIDLPWETDLDFVTDPNRSLGRYSYIVAGTERCYFRTFEEIPPPK